MNDVNAEIQKLKDTITSMNVEKSKIIVNKL